MFSRHFPKSALSILFCFLLILCAIGPEVLAEPPYDEEGIYYKDSRIDPDIGDNIKFWASGCTGWRPEYATFGTWDDACGAAPGITNDVVSLGDGGYALLTFDVVIADGPGPDLAVFENAFQMGDNVVFAELGFVEVSSNGQDFARFPSHSLTGNEEPMPGDVDRDGYVGESDLDTIISNWAKTPATRQQGDLNENGIVEGVDYAEVLSYWGTRLVGTFGALDPTDIHNLAGKHVNNMGTWLGTPFDLADLIADPKVLSGVVNLSNINYVKIIDVVGNGSTFDSWGNPIYDPYPTNFEAGGFDLDAVAVLNTAPPTEPSAAVPEPSTLLSLLLAGCIYAADHARKKSLNLRHSNCEKEK